MRDESLKYESRSSERTRSYQIGHSGRRKYTLNRYSDFQTKQMTGTTPKRYVISRNESSLSKTSLPSARSQIINRRRRLQALRRAQGIKKSGMYDGNPIGKMGGVAPGFDRKKNLLRSEVQKAKESLNPGGGRKRSLFRTGSSTSANLSTAQAGGAQGKRSILKTGRAVNASKKIKFRKKLDKKISSKKSKKSKAKGLFLQKLLDKFGRDNDGNLNIFGIILAIIMIIPILGTSIIIVAICSVVIAVVCAVLALWLFIVDLFTIKTEDMAITQAYQHVTWLDASKNKEVYERYQQLKEEKDKVYFLVNGAASDPEQFMYRSDGDKYLYYLNAKYEVYDIDKKISNSSNIFGATTIKGEMEKIHEYTFNYNVTEETKDTEKTITTVDPDSGEEKVEKIQETQDIATINVTAKTLQQFVDENPNTLTEDQEDRYYPIQDMDRFENKIFLDSPLGEGNTATVTENFGYQRRDPNTIHPGITITVNGRVPVYSTLDASIGGVDNNSLWLWTNIKKDICYWDIEDIQVKKGQKVKRGQLLGYANSKFRMAVKEVRPINRKYYNYPAIFFDDLAFNYESNTGYHAGSGGLTGELLNPPTNVTKWRELVKKAAEKYEIVGYENLILAIIWEESGGLDEQTPDIMQASESQGKDPNTIDSPEESIDVGTSYLATLLRQAKSLNLSEYAAVQAYNYGGGFLTWLAAKNIDYSFDWAKDFAAEKSNRQITEYKHPIAEQRGYNWRYKYGNMFYVDLITQHIMKDDDELVKIAKDEIGNSDGSRYWKWYGFSREVEWSSIFISWVANQAGYLDQGRVPKVGNTIDMVNWYKNNQRYKSTDEDYTPQAGDLIFFDWKGTKTGKDHVGIVEYSDGNIIQTIEGNSGGTVKRNTYDINNQAISGYGLTNATKE
ncbi:hypothetical protein IGK38_002437 [Enterococcus pernyi]|uniref:lysozyme family protein n=1 Tax=Enterococcus mundtii TaxID=53346 RepID=UPI0009D76939|nr:lysozyme family protein [Enterococcus mundtii]